MNSDDFEQRIIAIERELRDLKTAHRRGTKSSMLYTTTINVTGKVSEVEDE